MGREAWFTQFATPHPETVLALQIEVMGAVTVKGP